METCSGQHTVDSDPYTAAADSDRIPGLAATWGLGRTSWLNLRFAPNFVPVKLNFWFTPKSSSFVFVRMLILCCRF